MPAEVGKEAGEPCVLSLAAQWYKKRGCGPWEVEQSSQEVSVSSWVLDQLPTKECPQPFPENSFREQGVFPGSW